MAKQSAAKAFITPGPSLKYEALLLVSQYNTSGDAKFCPPK